MSALKNPAVIHFLAQLGDESVFVQVCIRRASSGYELFHVADLGVPSSQLQSIPPGKLRAVAESTASGAFRPLKSAPNLRTGWRSEVRDTTELEEAFSHLYPGGIADWFAAQLPEPPVSNFREFTSRQTGMYRVVTMLSDVQAAQTIRSCCESRFCLKRRLWTVHGLEPDTAAQKSILPCLEPCAILLEFARKAMRIEQEEKQALAVSPSDLESIRAALEMTLAEPRTEGGREADFGRASNARRLRMALEKLPAPPSRDSASPALE